MKSAPRAVVPIRAAVEPTPIASISGLAALPASSLDEEARTVVLRHGPATVTAKLDAALDTRVVRTAIARGERLIAQREGAEWVALGALRTAPTPGVDEGDEYTIKARRLALSADHEIALVSGASTLVLRAFGFVETVAQDITTRAAGVHKIVGRMIRLN